MKLVYKILQIILAIAGVVISLLSIPIVLAASIALLLSYSFEIGIAWLEDLKNNIRGK